jgi:ketosteroid isomerase-like protein
MKILRTGAGDRAARYRIVAWPTRVVRITWGEQTLFQEGTMTATASASGTAAVAQELVALCRAGRNRDAVEKLYDPNIVSVESSGDETMPAETTGIDAVRSKHEWWDANFEVHDSQVTGPFLGENQFAVQFEFETTFKPTGRRSRMTEMALYTVKNGKIVREHFFYNPSGA